MHEKLAGYVLDWLPKKFRVANAPREKLRHRHREASYRKAAANIKSLQNIKK